MNHQLRSFNIWTHIKKIIKSCLKRHPRSSTTHVSGTCRFKSEYASKHLEPKENKYQKKFEENVRKLEQVTHALTRKVLSLEKELTEIRNKNKITGVVERKGHSRNINKSESAVATQQKK